MCWVIDRAASESYSVGEMDDSAPRQLSHRWNALPRTVHVGLAVVLCALTTLFALVWMYVPSTSEPSYR